MRTLLGGWFNRLFRFLGQPVDAADHEKHHQSHDEEVDDVIDENPIIDGWCTRCLGLRQGGIFLTGKVDEQTVEI